MIAFTEQIKTTRNRLSSADMLLKIFAIYLVDVNIDGE